MLLSISRTTEDSALREHTPMKEETEGAEFLRALNQSASKEDLLTLPRVMRTNSYWLSTNMAQCLSLFKYSLDSNPMKAVSTHLSSAAPDLKMLTMPFLLLDMEPSEESTIGLSRTHGALNGVMKATSRSREESTCAQLLNATPIQKM